ncbi:hypothetical protein COO60DRAFT_995070 [Scenedesmus sp. NREL 46B-D3]|nr:hypothetical protein COO60DRAFT_995070 [Scenedesmus sp. NREL 46B-D3]
MLFMCVVCAVVFVQVGGHDDGFKGNKKARGMLRTKYPSMMQIGCQAHTLSLFAKDIANSMKTSWFSTVMARALVMFDRINDNTRLQSHMHQQQQQLHKKIRAFSDTLPNTLWQSQHQRARPPGQQVSHHADSTG